MSRRVAGIDISDRSIEIVSLLAKGPGIIERAMRVELPPDIVSRGEIQDFNSLSRVLRAMLDNLYGEGRGKTQVAISLPETIVYSKVFSLPAILDDKQTADALVLASSDEFPIEAATKIAYDFIELDETGGIKRYLFATVDHARVQEYLKVLEEANAEAVLIEPESAAMSRALVPYGEEKALMVADIGARTTTLVSFDEAGRQVISAAIPIGGDIFTEAIERKMKLSLEEAEKLKIRVGFDEDAEDGRVLMILQSPFEQIVSEIQRTLSYVAEERGLKTEKIILAGGTSLLPKIADYMSLAFGNVEVVSGDVLQNVGVSDEAILPKNFNNNAVLYATAIGLGIRAVETRGHPGLNLHPVARRSDRGGSFAPLRKLFNKLSSLMPTSKKKAAKKPAAKKTSKTTASKKKKAAKSARAKPAAKKGVKKKAKKQAEKKAEETKEEKVEATQAEPEQEVKEEAAAPIIPEEMASEASAEPAASEQQPEGQPDVGAEATTEQAGEPEGSPDDESAVVRGATADNPERDFGMGVGELLGSAIPDDDEDEDEEEDEEGSDDETASYEVKAASGASGEGERLSIESILSGKTPEDRAVPVPSAESHGSKWRIIVPIAVFLLALVVIAAGAGLFRSFKERGTSQKFLSAIMSVFVKDDQMQYGPETGPDTGPVVPEAVVVSVLVTSGEPEDGLAVPAVSSRLIETDIVLDDSFESTGEAQADDARAVGTITIVNELPRAFSFVARTRFLSPDGVLFRMSEPADIPASGTVDVEVYADEPGAQGDIGPTDFTIPGLSESLQESVYGRSSAPMTGGNGTVAAVSADDIEAAKSALIAASLDEARENFRAMAAEGELVLDELITSREIESDLPEAGTIGAAFDASMSIRFRALLVPESEIDSLLEARLAEMLPAGVNSADYGLGEPFYTREAHDTDADQALLRVEAPIQKL